MSDIIKICSICKLHLKESYFYKNKKQKDGYQTYCKKCHYGRNKKYYRANKDKWKNRRDTTRERNREFLFSYLLNNPCIDCGEKDIIVLEFDHVSGEKIKTVCELTRRGYSLSAIKDEIKKCVVRCANCHRRKTAKQRNWFKLKLINQS